MPAARTRVFAGAHLLVSATTGCAGVQSALDPRGRQASLLYDLSIVLFVGAVLVFVLVVGFLLVSLWVGRKGGPEPPSQRPALSEHAGPGKLRAVVLAACATALALVALLLYEFGSIRSLVAHAGEGLPIRVVAHQWWWEVIYLTGSSEVRVRTANELHIPVGRPVSIELQSRDVIHSFWVPNLQGKIDAIPGRTNHVTFQADVPGAYRGQCAEFCGLQHAKMVFHVVAEPAEQFEEWLARQESPAVEASEALARAGRDVFLGSSCALCHAVRGTPAMAAVAPDLTHLASRLTLASGTLENTRGNLGAWVLDPQHIKPGTRMPATHLDGQRLEALLQYLQTLK